MVRPMVHSTKHYVQVSITTAAADAVHSIIVADAVDVAAKDQVFEVEEGSSIKAIYMELWAKSTSDTVSTSCVLAFMKQIADSGNPSVAEMAALGDFDNKKNILYTTEGLININLADARTLFKGWIKIPKGKQRMGLSDRWTVNIVPVNTSMNICGFFTYKEYS